MSQNYRELPKKNFIETRDLLLEHIGEPCFENVPLEQCCGRAVARSYFAPDAVPNFARSPYDGFALRSVDVELASPDNPVVLKIVDEIRPGRVSSKILSKGEAVKILTGAPVPQTADCVIMHEKTSFTSTAVTVTESMKPQQNVVQIGEDQSKGCLLLSKGTVIDPAAAGLLASQGFSEICTYRKPRIGIISTGDEVQEIGRHLAFGKVYNANRYLLAAELQRLRFDYEYLGHCSDDPEQIAELLGTGLQQCDAVITTGGVSAGDYDYVPEAMVRCGVDVLAFGVKMKPGMACCYGMKNGRLCIALSGNPASAMTNFYAVAAPLLKKMAGYAAACPKMFKVKMLNDFSKTARADRLLRGTLVLENGVCEMVASREQGNAVISSMSGSDLLAVVPAGHGPVASGEILDAFLI